MCYMETASNRLREFSYTVDSTKFSIYSLTGRVKLQLQIDVVHPMVLDKQACKGDRSDLELGP